MTEQINIITVTVSSNTQTGKTGVMSLIKSALDTANVAAIYMQPEHRNNPPENWDTLENWDKPKNNVVVAISEENTPLPARASQ